MLGTPNRGAFAPVLALRGTYPFVMRLSRLDLAHSPEELAASVFCSFPGLYQLLPAAPARGEIDLLDPRSWPDGGSAARSGSARDAWPGSDAGWRARTAACAHIVGVNRKTVVSVRRTAGRVRIRHPASMATAPYPCNLARLSGLECYFADEAHGELANNPRHHRRRRRAAARRSTLRVARTLHAVARRATEIFDDAQLRAAPKPDKIDWRRLDSAQREAVLAELDGGRRRRRTSDESLA